MRPERRADIAALALALLAGLTAALVADRVFERMPHIEDEFAFLWQAEVMADGHAYLDSPPEPRSFLVPFVVDYEGRRFGKYPPGWPAALSLGARLDAAWLVNPILGILAIWLIYRLGSRVGGKGVGLLAALLAGTSPMYLMLTGNLMAHTFSLVLGAAFSLAWFDLFLEREARQVPTRWEGRLLPPLAGLSFGLLVLTRPVTALALGVPFAVHGLILLARGGQAVRRRLMIIGGLALAVGGLLPLWQAALTGDPGLNLYTLWWPYDRYGFGPGIGVKESGHNLNWAWINTKFSLRVGRSDLFGWPGLSWLFLPFGMLALRRRWDGWLLLATLPSLVLAYMAYWASAILLGPRYYYEALPGVAVVSALGVAWLAGILADSPALWLRWRRPAVAGLLLVLVSLNAAFYLPLRVGGLHGLYGMSRAPQQHLAALSIEPALIVVHVENHWSEYGTLLPLAQPFSENDVLMVYSRGERADSRLAAIYADRPVLHYYPEEPSVIYWEPRE